MDLADLIGDILPRTKPSRQLDTYDPGSAWYKIIDHGYAEVPRDDLDRLRSAVLADPVFGDCSGSIATRPDGGRSVSVEHISYRLLRDARRMPATEAVSALKRFIQQDSVEAILVCVVWGLHPSRSISITDAVDLVPLAALPQSQPQDALLGKPTYRGDPQRQHFVLSAKPRAALIKHIVHRPVFFRNPEERARQDTDVGNEFEALCKLATVLPVATGAPVVPLAQWSQVDFTVPFIGGVSGWGEPEYRHVFGEEIKATTYDESAIQSVITKYLALRAETQRQLAIPLDRLNSAMVERDSSRSAIELGIALESLLATDRSRDAPIAHLIKQRGALLLGGDFQNRRRHYALLNAAYDLRSRVVHGDTIPDTIRISVPGCDREEYSTKEFLRVSVGLCCELISVILAQQAFPDWERLQLCC